MDLFKYGPHRLNGWRKHPCGKPVQGYDMSKSAFICIYANMQESLKNWSWGMNLTFMKLLVYMRPKSDKSKPPNNWNIWYEGTIMRRGKNETRRVRHNFILSWVHWNLRKASHVTSPLPYLFPCSVFRKCSFHFCSFFRCLIQSLSGLVIRSTKFSCARTQFCPACSWM